MTKIICSAISSNQRYAYADAFYRMGRSILRGFWIFVKKPFFIISWIWYFLRDMDKRIHIEMECKTKINNISHKNWIIKKTRLSCMWYISVKIEVYIKKGIYQFNLLKERISKLRNGKFTFRCIRYKISISVLYFF